MRKKIAIFGLMLILVLGKLVMAQVCERIVPYGSPPDKRNGHVLVSSMGGNEQFVFGGFDQDPDLWILWQEGETWRWEYVVAKGTAPSSRGGHSGIFVSEGLGQDYIIIFGGVESPLDVPVDTDTYKLLNPWDPFSTWEKLITTGTVPSPRAEHTAVYEGGMKKMVVFGGYTSPGPIVASTDTYVLDFSVTPASWTKLNPSGGIPSARYGHSAVWAEMGMETGMIVFGGKDSFGNLLDDCRKLNLQGDNWTEIPVTGDKPPARWQHTAVWTWGEQGGEMIIFGGKGEDKKPIGDVWVLHQPGPFEPPDWR